MIAMGRFVQRTRAIFALVAALASASLLSGPTARAASYIDPASVDLRTVLAGPPTDSVSKPGGEIDTILAHQARATPSDIARAKSEVKLQPFLFADVLGPNFSAAKLPITVAFLERAVTDLGDVSAPAKTLWNRPRPPLQDNRVVPKVALPKTGSYPSFHAAGGELWGSILARLVPACASQVIARGIQVGDDRMIGGVHFPTDVAAGRQLADYVLARLEKSPSFAADAAAAKQEIQAVGTSCRG
jgi:acid phosphatase (class A)